jgi:glycine/D-amino acid oxidase-like deaminating enzyme
VQGTAAADDPTLDVLVVGAGMCGQTAGFALLREGVRKIRVIDAAARGDEALGHLRPHAALQPQAADRPRPGRAQPHLPRLVRSPARHR